MKATQEEQWRPVVGYEDLYIVSSSGKVWTRRRSGSRGGLLRLTPDGGGYLKVVFSQDNRQCTCLVHRVVAAAFIGPCPLGLEVRHLDGDRKNNDISNIRYGTRSENNLDQVMHGTHHESRKTHCPRGHPYDAHNTYYLRPPARGGRYCRACSDRRNALRRGTSARPAPSIPIEGDLP